MLNTTLRAPIIVMCALLLFAEYIPLATAQGTPFQCPNAWPLRRGLVAYDGGNAIPSDALLDYIGPRFELVIAESAGIVNRLLVRNPSLTRGLYDSLSDNYVPPMPFPAFTREHDWKFAHAAEYGVDPEDTYLHFWEDTNVTLGGQWRLIPGWQPNSPKPNAAATARNQSRVPVYFADLSRRAKYFGTPAIRALHRDYLVSLLQQPIASGVYWSGFFFDNSAFYAMNVRVNSGGQVAEHPTRAVLNSANFTEWHWFQNMALFMREFKDWAATTPPELGGRPLTNIANVANAPWIASSEWERAYVNYRSADILFLEFEFNTLRDHGRTIPASIFAKNRLAEQAGIELWQPGLTVTTRPPYLGNYTTDEAIMNTLGLHWVTRTSNVIILGHTTHAIMNADWAQNMKDVFDVDLGPPLGDPYVLDSGTDPHNYSYTVYARQFSCGLAIARMRGSWNEDINNLTRITLTLPGPYLPADADGNAYPTVTTWDLRNGQAQLFIAANVTTPPCIPSWQCTPWSACTGGAQTRTCTDANACGTSNGKPAESQPCTPPPSGCEVPQNLPPCDCVTLLEVQAAVQAWFRGTLPLPDFFALLRTWRGNPAC